MSETIRPGVYPTMITPFTDENELDLDAVDALMEYYAACGCDGVFALCQSSEIFFLSDAEKRRLMRRVFRANAGRMQLVASAHTAEGIEDQIRQLAMMAEEGADACVIILNRTARRYDTEDMCRRNIERILTALPDVRFGLYECPYPYKRLASPELIRWCAQTGRVVFLKDTSCDVAALKAKEAAARGTALTIFNANTATLLDSLRVGVRGYSGVMANFHADLYRALLALEAARDPRADELQAFLTLASWVEKQLYPVSAKAYRRMRGMNITLHARAQDPSLWNPTFASELEQLYRLESLVRRTLGLTGGVSS